MPQDVEAETELRNLVAVPYQIVSPANNAPIIGIFQDSLLGANRFTREGISFTPRQAMNLLMMFNRVNESALLEKGERITNFDILSQILPPMTLKYKTKLFKDDEKEKESNNVLEIRDGKYVRGQLEKGVLGGGTKGLLHRICNDFGNRASSDFVDDLQNIVTEYMKSSAYSVGISDLIADKSTNQKIIDIITDKKRDVKNLIDQTQIGVFENKTGKTNEEEFETQVNNILNQASAEAGKVGLKSLGKDNRFVTMVEAGSKGSDLNISFMVSCLGQQNVDGKRIAYGFDHRTLPHFTKYDDSPVARGFVESSYINGLSPQELFFHAMGGRVGLIDTAVKTSSTGYIQRRLIKGMEDLMVSYDMTVRTNKSKIVQFIYGDDGIDPIKVENQMMPLVSMSIQDVYAHFNIPDESGTTKALSAIFQKPVLARYKKQHDEWMKKCKEYTDTMITTRNAIVKNVFKNKGDAVVNCPVAFMHIINNIQGQQNINANSITDITPLEAFHMIEDNYANLEKIRCAVPTAMFKTLYYFNLSPKEIIINKRFNRAALVILLENILLTYKRAIVAPGEMVGMVAAQSIGEPTTQMSARFCEHVRCVKKNKKTELVSMVSGPIGELCDGIIADFPQYTFNTGHHDSVETLLEKLDDEYFIIGVDAEERTHWNKISHVSRHPVNGDMMRVTTKSGRVVETTTSHSHLVRSTESQSVVPIVGADMTVGMRIPVAKHIDNDFVRDTVVVGGGEYKLDHLFGWFIGAYLAEGSSNGESISISNISQHFIDRVEQFASLFEKEFTLRKYQGEYVPSFSHKPLADFIAETCGKGRSVKRIPDFAFLAPMAFKAGLVQAYFDGAGGKFRCDKGQHHISVCSRSKQLSKDMALFLNYFDIFASIKETIVRGSSIYNLYISSKYSAVYQSAIGSLVHTEKLNELVAYTMCALAYDLSDEIDKISGLGHIIAKCGKVLEFPGHSRTYGRWKKKDSIGRHTLEKYIHAFECDSGKDVEALIGKELRILNQAATSNVIWDEVVDIQIYTPDQKDYVYDFTVPANQTFMTDYGVIVHNTLNSVTFETHIIVRNREGVVQKVQIGEFIEKHIANPKKLEYYAEKDTTYAELVDYYEIPSCTENGDIVWREIEAVTQHPVINKDGTNTMLKVSTHENREVIATKAKSFLKLVDGKIIPVDGDTLKVGDFIPVSTKQIDFAESSSFDLRKVLPPTEYIYSAEVDKAKAVMHETHWWKKHQGTTFVLPYRRSDSFVVNVSDKIRPNCKSKTTFTPGCVYMLQNNMNKYTIPEVIPLDYNFGYLLGAYAAEGCMTRFQVSIANNDANYFTPILELCKQWNITTKVYRHENKNGQEGWTSQDLRIYNTVLCRILEKMCGKLSHNKFVSDTIIFSNKECISGFIDAYIGGDGCIDAKSNMISASSVSKELLMDVQQMLNILGVYSFITKCKKQESNNCGTLPENIHQMYCLYVRNHQAQILASMLNTKLDYKIENTQKIINHKFMHGYEYNRNYLTVPNEINGEIVFESRTDKSCKDVLFDKIISIEEVPNTGKYAYDLTVADTRNFNIYNGLALRDTFHFAGVSSKSNVTRGVPRIEEILSLSSEPKNPSLTIFLNAEDEVDRDKTQTIMYMLEHTKMVELVAFTEICFDPDDLNTCISQDESTMEQYRAFENMIDECMNASMTEETNEKSKWILRMEMNPEAMLEKNITMDDVNFTLKNTFGDDISCVYSDHNADKLVFRIRMNNVVKMTAARAASAKKNKMNPLDQSDHIYVLKNFQDQLLHNIIIRGVKNINRVIMRKIKDNMVEQNGVFKKQDMWVLDTIGSNIIDVLALDCIDANRTFSNDIIETFNVFGIEAARQTIYNELVEVIEFDGTYVNFHHMSMLCDRMTFTNKLISIFRHGINKDDIGPIAKASFEETPEMFLKAARHAELDIMRGVSANVMCGQEGMFGTNAFQVVLNLDEMRKLEETSQFEKTELNESIEKMFGGLENPDDKCSSNNLIIQNNVVSIKPSDMGKDNEYNPGF